MNITSSLTVPIVSARLPGLNLSVGSFLPRLRLPSVAGPLLAPVDMVDEGALAICVYNPGAVNPFSLPPRGVDLPRRFAMLQERAIALYVISGLPLPRLEQWLDLVGLDIHALSDADRALSSVVGIPIKRVEGHNFRTHVSFILQEDRILSILLETDLVHQFEQLLMALDVARGDSPQQYDLPDKPWHQSKRSRPDAGREPIIETLDPDDY